MRDDKDGEVRCPVTGHVCIGTHCGKDVCQMRFTESHVAPKCEARTDSNGRVIGYWPPENIPPVSAASTTPRSETPRTAAIARKWSLKGGGTNTSDASPEAKELYEHAEELERELRKLAAEYADLKVYGRTTASAMAPIMPDDMLPLHEYLRLARALMANYEAGRCRMRSEDVTGTEYDLARALIAAADGGIERSSDGRFPKEPSSGD